MENIISYKRRSTINLELDGVWGLVGFFSLDTVSFYFLFFSICTEFSLFNYFLEVVTDRSGK